MERCAQLAREFGVNLGAHPGVWDRAQRGRGVVDLKPGDLELLLLQQVSSLVKIAAGTRLHHIKLHGALYHATEDDLALGLEYLRAVRRWWPNVILYVRSGGKLAKLATQLGLRVWEEIFADRGYQPDGKLVPRGEPGALIPSIRSATARMKRILGGGELLALDGAPLRLRAQTVCVHSDTPGAVRLARAISSLITSRRRAWIEASRP
jgi:UPF0271 protein